MTVCDPQTLIKISIKRCPSARNSEPRTEQGTNNNNNGNSENFTRELNLPLTIKKRFCVCDFKKDQSKTLNNKMENNLIDS